jgi:hypothetical protein
VIFIGRGLCTIAEPIGVQYVIQRRIKMDDLFPSRLYDQNTFYNAFFKDLHHAKSLAIIESPYITKKRMAQLIPVFRKLRSHNVRIIVNTKPLEEHNPLLYEQVLRAIGEMQDIGIEVFMTVGHHRKLAIIDESILWEGSLNILSQNDSCEIMRRIKSNYAIKEMTKYTGIDKWF